MENPIVTGRIKAIDAYTGRPMGWIRQERNPRGCYGITENMGDGLVASLRGTNTEHLVMLDRDSELGNLIGIVWLLGPRSDVYSLQRSATMDITLYGGLAMMECAPGYETGSPWKCMSALRTFYSSPALPDVWTVGEDGMVLLSWTSPIDGVTRSAEVAMARHPDGDDDFCLQLTNDFERLRDQSFRWNSRYKYTKVHLLFQPIE